MFKRNEIKKKAWKSARRNIESGEQPSLAWQVGAIIFILIVAAIILSQEIQ